MLPVKKITLSDNEVNKIFTITKLSAVGAIVLGVNLIQLCASMDFAEGMMLQQLIHDMLQTGVKIEGVDQVEYNNFLEMGMPKLIALLITTILNNLTDDKIQTLIFKCCDNVVLENGADRRNLNEAIKLFMVEDFAVILVIIEQVLLFNYGGSKERIKKLRNSLALNNTLMNT